MLVFIRCSSPNLIFGYKGRIFRPKHYHFIFMNLLNSSNHSSSPPKEPINQLSLTNATSAFKSTSR